jgi:hypothetical protein
MASLVLSTVGNMILPGLGGTIGGYIGGIIDRKLFGPKAPKTYGPRLGDLTVQTSTEGASLPIVYGTMRIAGNVIWSTGLTESSTTTEQGGGGSGGGGGSYTTYSYSTDCAVALCAGIITGVRRIWADTKLIYDVGSDATLETLLASNKNNIRIYTGSETQLCDPLIQAVEGTDLAYRGTAYVVFEDLQLADYGNRLPNFSFEVLKNGSINNLTYTSISFGSNVSFHNLVTIPYIDNSNIAYIWDIEHSTSSPLCKIYTMRGDSYPTLYKSFRVSIAAPLISYYSLTESSSTCYCKKSNSIILAKHLTISPYGVQITIINGDTGITRQILTYISMPYGSVISTYHEDKYGNMYFLMGYGGPNIGYFWRIKENSNILETIFIDPTWSFTSTPSIVGSDDTFMYLFIPTNRTIYRYYISTLELDTTTWQIPINMEKPINYWDGIFYFSSTTTIFKAVFGEVVASIEASLPHTASLNMTSYNAFYKPIAANNYSLLFNSYYNNTDNIYHIKKAQLTTGTQTVKEVVEDISNKSGVPSTKYNYSALSGKSVKGFVVSKVMSAKAALDSLQAGYNFELVEEAGKIIAKDKSAAVSNATLTNSTLGAEQI